MNDLKSSYLCEIAFIFGTIKYSNWRVFVNKATRESYDLDFEAMHEFYEMIYDIANEDKSKGLLQSIYDIMENYDLLENMVESFYILKKYG